MADVVKARRKNAEREEETPWVPPYSDDLPPDLSKHSLSPIFRKVSHILMSENFHGLPPATKPNWGADKVCLIAGKILEEKDTYVKVRNAKSNRTKRIWKKNLLPCAEVGSVYREISTGWWYVVVRRTHLDVHIRCVLTNSKYICFSRNHILFCIQLNLFHTQSYLFLHNHIWFTHNYI